MAIELSTVFVEWHPFVLRGRVVRLCSPAFISKSFGLLWVFFLYLAINSSIVELALVSINFDLGNPVRNPAEDILD